MDENVVSRVDAHEVAPAPLGLAGCRHGGRCAGCDGDHADDLGELVGTVPATNAAHTCATAVEAVTSAGIGFWSRVFLAVGILVALFISVPVGAVFMALAMLLLSQ